MSSLTIVSMARVARAAYRMDSEGAVDNRVLLAALTRACRAEGVTWVRGAVSSLDDLDADRVILAAGTGSADLAGLPVRPVKGEDRYFVVTTWASEEDFQRWRDGRMPAAHAAEQGGRPAPVATGADLLEFEVVDLG